MRFDTTRPRVAVLSASTALLALVGGWTWAAAAQPGGFDSLSEPISALASLTTPHRWIMTAGFVITGLAHLLTAATLGLPGRWARLALGAGGAATLGVAAVPIPGRDESSLPHFVVAGLAFGFLSAWPALAVREAAWAPPAVKRAAYGFSGASGIGTVLLPLPIWGGYFGLAERVVAGGLVAAPLVAAVTKWWRAGRPLGTRRTRFLLGTMLWGVGCMLGGIAATDVAPSTVKVGYYRAQISLEADPRDASQLTATTIFGDIDVDFAGLAPGIRVAPQVSADIANEFAGGEPSLERLRPDDAALGAGVSLAALGLLGRFAIGAALVALAGVGIVVFSRRERPTSRVVLGAVAAWFVATAGTGAMLAFTYTLERQRTFTATELLGTVQRNQGLLTNVETRASQVAPYVRNVLAVSTALQQTYAATSLEADPSLRLLAVSDIHDGNDYPLLRTIIKDQSVDAVLDTGDLLTFGTVREGEAAGLFKGIESLKVPYLFVRGNHDATSPNDTAVLAKLASLDNVILLDPPSGGFQEVTLGGITIAGFNDPRWFGDSGKNTAAAQVPARERFQAAFAGRRPPDLVASHEPWALEGVSGGVLINGHMHTPDIEGNRIQVGTLTGGGPWSHYLEDTGGEELRGQPSSFGLLTFSPACRLSSVTTFTFRGVYEGRPAYDSVVMTNGAQIDTREVDPERTCVAGSASITTVPTAP